MGLFNFRKKGKIIDLSRNLNEENKTAENSVGLAESSETNKANTSVDDINEKRKRLANSLEKIESLSNQIYHLEQRVEVLEKKLRVNNFEGE